jgi:hypothetical protein
MQQFQITLKNEKRSLYKRIAILIIFINLVFLLYAACFSPVKSIQYKSIALLVFLLFVFLLQRYFKNSKYEFGLHPYFFFIMLFWANLELYWLAAAMFIFDMLHTMATRKLTIGVSTTDISWPSAFPKKVQWAALNNILLKDNLLTVDFKNDKIVQQYIDETTIAVNEAEFNDFCRQQLSTTPS